MKNHKPLLSSAPAHSILNAQSFQYTSSADTDIRKTFARIRREREKAAAVIAIASNVRSLAAKVADVTVQPRLVPSLAR